MRGLMAGIRGTDHQARPPGPRGAWGAGNLAAYESDRLGFLLATRDQYGGLVTFDRMTSLVHDPDLAVEVLGRPEFAITGNFLNQRIGAVEVHDVLTARRHMNPGLRAAAVRCAGPATADQAMVRFRSSLQQGSVLDPLPEFEALFSGIVAEHHFGRDGVNVAPTIGSLACALSIVFGNPFALPHWVPTPANVRVSHRYRAVRTAIDPLIERRLYTGADTDFAATVARAAAGEGIGTDRITHLLIGSMLAAQVVPAAAAAWALAHLAEGGLAERVRDGRLPITAVIAEAVRLHPPTWLLRRTALTALELGGYRYPAGHGFLVSPYVIHRDARCFPQPLEFMPERWLGADRRAQRSLLAFGRGLHRCPGRDLALATVASALTALISSYDIEATNDVVMENPRTTLLPDGLRIRFTERRDGNQALEASERRFSTR